VESELPSPDVKFNSELETSTEIASNEIASNEIASKRGRHTARGVFGLFAVHVLLMPLGLVVTGYLSRQLGPEPGP